MSFPSLPISVNDDKHYCRRLHMLFYLVLTTALTGRWQCLNYIQMRKTEAPRVSKLSSKFTQLATGGMIQSGPCDSLKFSLL